MIERIRKLLLGQGGGDTAPDAAEDDPQVAAVALLIEAAVMDGDFDEAERHVIAGLLKHRFGLEPGAVEDLIAAGADAVEGSNQLYAFTRVVKQGFDFEQRIGMIEMLWEVAYADGEVHDFEGDGAFLYFEGPGEAVPAAFRLRDELLERGLDLVRVALSGQRV